MTEPEVIAPDGELDIANVGLFREALAQAVANGTSRDLVVDLSAVEFIDSSSLGAVIEANDRLARAQRRCRVVAPRGSAAAVMLTLTGLRQRLAVFETRTEALRA